MTVLTSLKKRLCPFARWLLSPTNVTATLHAV
jgi:hypothetical protein